MTTVVVYKGVMAADSRRSWSANGAYQDDVCKIKVVRRLYYRKQRVAAFAVAGDTNVNSHIVKDFTAPDRLGVDGDVEEILLEYNNQLIRPSSSVLLLLDDGTAVSFSYSFRSGKYRWVSQVAKADDEDAIYCIGSGGPYVERIFDDLVDSSKLTAGDYAAIACALDTHSGGEITIYSPSLVRVVRNYTLSKEKLDTILDYFKHKLLEGRTHEEVTITEPDHSASDTALTERPSADVS
jgi:hypothetical protein